MQRLLGKTAIVTAGTGNLGSVIVRKLAEEGADVVFTYLTNVVKAKDVESEIKTLGRIAVPVRCDVRKLNEVENVVNTAIKRFKKVDILVNNAATDSMSTLFETTEEIWNEIIDINLKGTFYFIKSVVPYMIKQNYGKIVNITSTAGLRAEVSGAVYTASKFGINGLTQKYARELGKHGININCIAPGQIVRSHMSRKHIQAISSNTPLRKATRPEDVAKAVIFFASSDSDLITGHTLIVDAGYYPGGNW